MKKCSSCKLIFEENMFYKNKYKNDNLGSECKNCVKKYYSEKLKCEKCKNFYSKSYLKYHILKIHN